MKKEKRELKKKITMSVWIGSKAWLNKTLFLRPKALKFKWWTLMRNNLFKYLTIISGINGLIS